MNGRPYTKKELAYLAEHYAFAGAAACAAKLGRTTWSVKSAVQRYKLIPRPNHMWTKQDFATLREHYPRKGAKILAAMIGSTPRSVQRKAQLKGIRYVGPDKLTKRRCGCCGVWKPLAEFTPTGKVCSSCKATPAPQAVPGSTRTWRRKVAAEKARSEV